MSTDTVTLPAIEELKPTDEIDYGPSLTDVDLAQVVGGLARIWIGEPTELAEDDPKH